MISLNFAVCGEVILPRLPPLHSAIVIGNGVQIRRLLENGININAMDHDGHTALHWAVRSRNLALIRFLLDNGADASIQNHDGDTPFDLARRGANPNIARVIESHQLRHSFAITAFEVNHLFAAFQLIFTNGIAHWSDADILLLGEKHTWCDLTRGFISHFSPAEPLLICVEGTPSMKPIADYMGNITHYLDYTNVLHRRATLLGWDAEKYLMSIGADSEYYRVLIDTRNIYLDGIAKLKREREELCPGFTQTNDPFQFMNMPVEMLELLLKSVERSKKLYDALENVNKEIRLGRVTDQQLQETFPHRTKAMVSTIKKVGCMFARGMPGKAVFHAGASHLHTSQEDRSTRQFCLDSLYEELRRHKVAVIVQTM